MISQGGHGPLQTGTDAATTLPAGAQVIARALASRVDLAALAAFIVVAWLYVQRLTVWLVGDDEGSYLYAAWRMSLGEVPYRDFLTPQLPAFLVPGGWLMAHLGPGVLAARLLATAATLAAGVCTWYAARRLFGPAVGLLAGAALLLHPDVFLFGRTFRADPFMLFYATLGVALFTRAVLPAHALDFGGLAKPSAASGESAESAVSTGPAGLRLQQVPTSIIFLTLSGLAFGLATLCKLFGPLPMAACLAWLVVDGKRRQRPLRAIVMEGTVLCVAAGVTFLVGVGYFYVQSPAFLEATVGHHLRQGAGLGPFEIVSKGLAFYLAYLRQNGNALLVFVALAAGLMAARMGDRRRLVFTLQLPTALAFLVLSRDAYERHLLYLVPALAVLFAVAVFGLSQRDRALGVGLVLALLAPWWLLDVDHAWRWETGTARMADFVQLVTRPDDLVFSDYSELNFYAARPTTYSAASLSAGATRSGQITWRRIQDELAGKLPPLLVLDTDPSYAHLVFLHDRPDFLAWVKDHYGAPIGTFQRDNQHYEMYAPDGKAPRLGQFAGGMALIAGGPAASDIQQGHDVDIRIAWQATAPISDELTAAVRLVDDEGREWAAADGAINASDPDAELRVRPTGRWAVGEITTDRVTLRVPDGTPPGKYHLQVGVYGIEASGPRLRDVVSESGSVLGQFVSLGEIRVAPAWLQENEVNRPRQFQGTPEAYVMQSNVSRLIGAERVPSTSIPAGTVLTQWTWWYLRDDTLDRACVTLAKGGSGTGIPMSEPVIAGLPAAGDPFWLKGGLLIRWPFDVIVPTDTSGGQYEVTLGEHVRNRCIGNLLNVAESIQYRIGYVDVSARDLSGIQRALPPLQTTVDAQVGQVGRLAGVNGLPASLGRGETMTVTLVWQAIAPSRVPLKATVQLLCPDGRPCAQDDREPADWQRPTTSWLPGEVILDPHPLVVPSDLAPGRYPLVAGLYNPGTSRRNAVTGSDGGGDVVRLGEVEVR